MYVHMSALSAMCAPPENSKEVSPRGGDATRKGDAKSDAQGDATCKGPLCYISSHTSAAEAVLSCVQGNDCGVTVDAVIAVADDSAAAQTRARRQAAAAAATKRGATTTTTAAAVTAVA